jgi:23S rRNA (uridine2552-2'-O)-methyltransferase
VTGAGPKTRVRTAKGRAIGSTRWLERQLNDPLVHEARRQGFRARSVFKLEELDRRHGLIARGMKVVDLGAAPGSWTQYAAQKGATVIAVDLLAMGSVPGAEIIEGDFLDPQTQAEITARLGGPADLVLSDIAPNATGNRALDRLRVEATAEAALAFAAAALRPGGACLVKLLKGAEAALVPLAQAGFAGWRLVKPKATRSESSEIYLLATGRRGDAGCARV